MIEPSRTRYNALVELVVELYASGKQPRAEWLEEIEATRQMYPEWAVPPVPVVVPYIPDPPATPPAAPPSDPPQAAAPMTNERVPILVDEEMERVVREVLTVWGRSFSVFQTSGRLFEIQFDQRQESKYIVREKNSPRMVQIGSSRARALASKMCRFGRQKHAKNGTPVLEEQLPPDWLGPSITTRVDFPNVPFISALTQSPTLRSDGALIHQPGYDASTGIYLVGDVPVNVPEQPTQEDAQKAAARLLDLYCDFDFANPAGKSVCLAGLLSIVCRHTYSGSTPLILIDSSRRGSGKSRLVDTISLIATGRTSPGTVFSKDETEMDKRIMSLALAGEQLVLIDNVVNKLASASLDMAITRDSYCGRLLTKSEMPAVPMKIVWFVTGNGLTVGADTARRSLMARLEPDVEYPEYRTGPRPGVAWKYDLLNYIPRNRSALLSDALTVVSAYIRAGRPKVALKKAEAMGSFEGWSTTIRAAIVWAGVIDPCDTISDVQDTDIDDQAAKTMIENWPFADDMPVTTQMLVKKAESTMPGIGMSGDTANEMWRNALLEWLPAKGTAFLPTPRDLGYALRALKGSILNGYRIEAGKHTRSGTPWMRVRDASAAPAQSPTDPTATNLAIVK